MVMTVTPPRQRVHRAGNAGAGTDTVITIQRPQPKQWEFLNAKAKYIAYGGARGGGKSWAVRTKAVALCLVHPGIRILILRRTYKELEENHIEILKKEMSGAATYNDTKKQLTFVTGSTIKFGYCDCERDLDQYQGPEYDVLFIDEATQIPENWYKILAACVRGINDFPKRLYLTCNPGGVGHAWVKRLFIERNFKKDEDPEDHLFIPAKVTDNPILIKTNPGYVKFLDNLPDGIREAWRDGNWDVFTGQFFTEWDRDVHVVDPIEVPGWWRWYLTIDYGMDMLAAYLIAMDDKGTAWVADEAYEGRDLGDGHDGLIISDAAEFLLKMVAGRQVTYLAPPDMWSKRQETGKSAADIFRESGITLTKTSNDRVDGWFAMRERLKVRKGIDGKPAAGLKIFKNCANLIRTLPQLMYDTNKPSDASKEPHEITHAPDAIRGFCVYWTMKPKKPHNQSKTKWTPDMWEDYNNANAELRRYLRGKWGNPPG